MKLLVTGGAGFIGSCFVRLALERWRDAGIVILDALTYAGRLDNLDDVLADPRVLFIHGDICDPETVDAAMAGCTHVLNFAAETHVDRSILDPARFLRTDVEGTRVLLEASRRHEVTRYLQVSTDEVYGHLPAPARAGEDTPLRPRSPYAASKAAGDLLTLSYHTTYGLPALITRGANTYGPRQYPEKLIPLFVTNALTEQPLPLYSDGRQERDWLHVEDHSRGVAAVLERGTPGEAYNIGYGQERPNIEIAERILALTGADPALLRQVADRPGHDRRYALDSARLRTLGWQPHIDLETGLRRTVTWYREHRAWWEARRDGAFEAYYREQYAARLAESWP